jgi:Ca-activated chloride channel family protein
MPQFPILLAEQSWRFAHPWLLLLLLLIPVLAVLKGRRGPSASVQFSSLHIINRLGGKVRSRAGGLRNAILYLTFALLVLALARPQEVRSSTTHTESGVELIIAIDVSRSMQAEDFFIGGRKVNRLQAAKKVTREFIRGRESDRIGLVAFAGQPYLVSPLTLDHEWVESNMGQVQIGSVEDGTAIGSAIGAAARRLDKRESKSKVVVLLTDGANNSGSLQPETAAKLAKTLGIRIYTIAVGTYGNHVIPTPYGPQTLIQEYDEETLQAIATISEGAYFRAQDTDSLEKIFDNIDQLEKTELSSHVMHEFNEQFYWFAGAALVFGLLSMVADETFSRRLP